MTICNDLFGFGSLYTEMNPEKKSWGRGGFFLQHEYTILDSQSQICIINYIVIHICEWNILLSRSIEL